MMRNLVNNSIGRNIFVNLLIMFLNYFIPQLLFIFVKRFTPYYIYGRNLRSHPLLQKALYLLRLLFHNLYGSGKTVYRSSSQRNHITCRLLKSKW